MTEKRGQIQEKSYFVWVSCVELTEFESVGFYCNYYYGNQSSLTIQSRLILHCSVLVDVFSLN